MSILLERIEGLCNAKGISGYRMCKDVGISPNNLTELRAGRKKGLSAKNAEKIAKYFNVSVSYLLGTEDSPETDIPAGLSKEEWEYIKWFRSAAETDKELVRLVMRREK